MVTIITTIIITITFGTAALKEPISVTMVRTVVIPSAIRAGTASFETQKDSHDSTTISTVGA